MAESTWSAMYCRYLPGWMVLAYLLVSTKESNGLVGIGYIPQSVVLQARMNKGEIP